MTKVVISLAQNEEDLNDTIELVIRSKNLLEGLGLSEPEEGDSTCMLVTKGWCVGRVYQEINSLVSRQLDTWFTIRSDGLMRRLEQIHTDEENSSEKEGVKGEE